MNSNEKAIAENAGRRRRRRGSLEEASVSGLVMFSSQGKRSSSNWKEDGFTLGRGGHNNTNHVSRPSLAPLPQPSPPRPQGPQEPHLHHHNYDSQTDKLQQQEPNLALSALTSIKKLPQQLIHGLAAQKILCQSAKQIPNFMSQTMKSEYFQNGGSCFNEKLITVNPNCRIR